MGRIVMIFHDWMNRESRKKKQETRKLQGTSEQVYIAPEFTPVGKKT
jgi:hypothetical protein